ncbi:MAG: hypothetical protein IJ678_07785, partial [Kiritimatiellae bacterium]|nr:hypothetical protein [Kiritimatiellia bacterium]
AVPERLARATGGVAVPPSRLSEALSGFGEPRRIARERTEFPLWSHWGVFALLLALYCSELLLRKASDLN